MDKHHSFSLSPSQYFSCKPNPNEVNEDLPADKSSRCLIWMSKCPSRSRMSTKINRHRRKLGAAMREFLWRVTFYSKAEGLYLNKRNVVNKYKTEVPPTPIPSMQKDSCPESMSFSPVLFTGHHSYSHVLANALITTAPTAATNKYVRSPWLGAEEGIDPDELVEFPMNQLRIVVEKQIDRLRAVDRTNRSWKNSACRRRMRCSDKARGAERDSDLSSSPSRWNVCVASIFCILFMVWRIWGGVFMLRGLPSACVILITFPIRIVMDNRLGSVSTRQLHTKFIYIYQKDTENMFSLSQLRTRPFLYW